MESGLEVLLGILFPAVSTQRELKKHTCSCNLCPGRHALYGQGPNASNARWDLFVLIRCRHTCCKQNQTILSMKRCHRKVLWPSLITSVLCHPSCFACSFIPFLFSSLRYQKLLYVTIVDFSPLSNALLVIKEDVTSYRWSPDSTLQEQWIPWWVCGLTCKCQSLWSLSQSGGIHRKRQRTFLLRVSSAIILLTKACNDEAAPNEPTAGHATCHDCAYWHEGTREFVRFCCWKGFRRLGADVVGLIWLRGSNFPGDVSIELKQSWVLPKGASHEPGECTSCWAEYLSIALRIVLNHKANDGDGRVVFSSFPLVEFESANSPDLFSETVCVCGSVFFMKGTVACPSQLRCRSRCSERSSTLWWPSTSQSWLLAVNLADAFADWWRKPASTVVNMRLHNDTFRGIEYV